MTDHDHGHDFDAELDATLAAMTATDHIEARARVRLLEALDRRPRSFSWLTLPRVAAAAAAAVIIAVLAGGPWTGTRETSATPPLLAVSRLPTMSPPAPPVVGTDTGRVEATTVVGRRATQPPAWRRWDVEIDPLDVPPLVQPGKLATEPLALADVALKPIEIEAIELTNVDEDASPHPYQ
jgi:hypothetical protein